MSSKRKYNDYSCADIVVLEWHECIRCRPRMYLCDATPGGLLGQVALTLAARLGPHDDPRLVLTADERTASVEDFGPGLPLAEGEPGAEVVRIATHLHSPGNLNGLTVANALSWDYTVDVRGGRTKHRVRFCGGVVVSPLDVVGPCEGTGTKVSFKLHNEVFGPDERFTIDDLRSVAEQVVSLRSDLRVHWLDRVSGRTGEAWARVP